MEHWKPEEPVVRPRFGARKRLRSLDEFVMPEFVGRMARLRRRHRLPPGAFAALVLLGAACIGVGIGLYQMMGPRDVIADEAAAGWNAVRDGL